MKCRATRWPKHALIFVAFTRTLHGSVNHNCMFVVVLLFYLLCPINLRVSQLVFKLATQYTTAALSVHMSVVHSHNLVSAPATNERCGAVVACFSWRAADVNEHGIPCLALFRRWDCA